MRLLGRLRRIARVLATRPPFDPRRTLSEAARDAAKIVLGRLAAEPPERVEPELADWFERVIRPRLLSWLRYQDRQRDWAERRRVAWKDAQYWETQARMGYFPADSPAFAGNVQPLALRLLGFGEAAEEPTEAPA